MHMLNTFFLAVLYASAPSAPSPAQQAEALLQEAIQLRGQHRPEDALARLERAEQLAPSPKLSANRGLVEATLDRWVAAEQHLASALSSQDPWVAKNRDSLSITLTKVLDHLGRITVTGRAGTDVTIGEEHVGLLPMKSALSVLAADVTISGRLPGFLPVVRTIALKPGDNITVPLVQVPEPTAVASTTPPTSPASLWGGTPSSHESASRSWPLWAAGGAALVGVAAVGTGAWLVHRDGQDACASLPGGARCGKVYDTATVGWVAVGTGAAALVGAGVFLWFGLTHDAESIALGPGTIGGTF